MSNPVSPEHAASVFQAEELRDLLFEATRRAADSKVRALQLEQQLASSQTELQTLRTEVARLKSDSVLPPQIEPISDGPEVDSDALGSND